MIPTCDGMTSRTLIDKSCGVSAGISSRKDLYYGKDRFE